MVVTQLLLASAGVILLVTTTVKRPLRLRSGSAEAEATRPGERSDPRPQTKNAKPFLEAKDEAFRLKAEVDAQRPKPTRRSQRRAEIARQENRIDQKETALDRKTEALEKSAKKSSRKAEGEAEAHLAEVDAIRAKEMERLETLAGLSQEDAREVLLHKVDEELTHEKGRPCGCL